MRLLGALVVAIVMYIAVPLLWQHAMVAKVTELSKGPSPIPVGAPIASIDTSNMAAAMNPKIEIDTRKYEQIAIQSQADQAMRQAQAAQDTAWQAQHPDVH